MATYTRLKGKQYRAFLRDNADVRDFIQRQMADDVPGVRAAHRKARRGRASKAWLVRVGMVRP